MKSIPDFWRKAELCWIPFEHICGIHPQVKHIAPLSDVDCLLTDPSELSFEGVILQAISVPVMCKKMAQDDYRVVGGFRTYQYLLSCFGDKPDTKIPVLAFRGGKSAQLQAIAQYSVAGVPLVNCLGMRAPKQIGQVVLEMNPQLMDAKRGRRPKNEEITEDGSIFRTFFPKVTSLSGLARLMGVKPDVILSLRKK